MVIFKFHWRIGYYQWCLLRYCSWRQTNRFWHEHEPPCDKTPTYWHVRPAKTQISLGIRPVWSESSLCAQWVAKDPSFLHAGSEDSDQTGRIPRLIFRWAHRPFWWFCHEAAQHVFYAFLTFKGSPFSEIDSTMSLLQMGLCFLFQIKN